MLKVKVQNADNCLFLLLLLCFIEFDCYCKNYENSYKCRHNKAKPKGKNVGFVQPNVQTLLKVNQKYVSSFYFHKGGGSRKI